MLNLSSVKIAEYKRIARRIKKVAEGAVEETVETTFGIGLCVGIPVAAIGIISTIGLPATITAVVIAGVLVKGR